MVKLISLDKARVDREPYLLWNSCIDLISESEPEDLSDIQSVAQFAFWYDSEVQNGGHLQYFENSYIRYESKINVLISATLEALKRLGAKKQTEILASASAKYLSSLRKHPKDIQEYVELELEGEFEKFDNRYYICSPDMNDYLDKYFQSHISDFVELV